MIGLECVQLCLHALSWMYPWSGVSNVATDVLLGDGPHVPEFPFVEHGTNKCNISYVKLNPVITCVYIYIYIGIVHSRVPTQRTLEWSIPIYIYIRIYNSLIFKWALDHIVTRCNQHAMGPPCLPCSWLETI